MNKVSLLAIVEVEKTDRVICRAPGCGHSVYKRIHVIRLDGKVTVYGSECFKRLRGYDASEQPHYGTSTGRKLTHEERQLLIENTEKLITQFEAELQTATAKIPRHPTEAPELRKIERSENKPAAPPVATIRQTNISDEWARRQAAREAWQRDKLLATSPISTPQPSTKEWERWEAADWAEWAKRRLEGKASWLDAPEAMIAWKALTAGNDKK